MNGTTLVILLFTIPISLAAVVGFYVVVAKLAGKAYRNADEQSSTEPEPDPDNEDEDKLRSDWEWIGDRYDLTPFSSPDGLSWAPGYRGTIRGLPIRIRLQARPSPGCVVTVVDVELPFPWAHFEKATSFSLSVPVRPEIPLTGTKEIRSCRVETPIQPRLKELDDDVELSIQDGHLEVTTSYFTSLQRTWPEHLDRVVGNIADGLRDGLVLEIGELPEALALEITIRTDIVDGEPTTRLEVAADFSDDWPTDFEIHRRGSDSENETGPTGPEDFNRLFAVSAPEDSDRSLVDDRLRHQLLELAGDFDEVSIANGQLRTTTELTAFEMPADEMIDHLDEAVERTGGATLELLDEA